MFNSIQDYTPSILPFNFLSKLLPICINNFATWSIKSMYYLYVKTHKVTGLKYLGQTSKDPFKYNGSGTRWTNHIKKYGNIVETDILFESVNRDDIKEKGKYYSNLWNIVKDKKWANIVPEEGTGGDTSMSPNFINSLKNRDLSYTKTKEFRKKMSDSIKLMWEEKFNSAEFDNESYKKMCADRTKTMWQNRGISEQDRIHRSVKQKEYINKPGSKEKLSQAAKNAWIKKSNIYEITFPDGHTEEIKCLRGWCKEKNLPYYKLYNTLRHHRMSQDGWFVRII